MITKYSASLISEVIKESGSVSLTPSATNRLVSVMGEALARGKDLQKVEKAEANSGVNNDYGILRNHFVPDCDYLSVSLPYGWGKVYSNDSEFLYSLRAMDLDLPLYSYQMSNHRALNGEYILKNIDKVIYVDPRNNSFVEKELRSLTETINYKQRCLSDDDDDKFFRCIKKDYAVEIIRDRNVFEKLIDIREKNKSYHFDYNQSIKRARDKHKNILEKAMVNIDLFTTIVNLEIAKREYKKL